MTLKRDQRCQCPSRQSDNVTNPIEVWLKVISNVTPLYVVEGHDFSGGGFAHRMANDQGERPAATTHAK